VSSTLGKKGLIETEWLPLAGEDSPVAGEFWRVIITAETFPGTNRGCFKLQPIHRVLPGSIRKLVPGFFSTRKSPDGGVLIVDPTHGIGDVSAKDVDYILQLDMKKVLFASEGVYAIVVDLGGDYWISPHTKGVVYGLGQSSGGTDDRSEKIPSR